jgi:hypothetical protein
MLENHLDIVASINFHPIGHQTPKHGCSCGDCVAPHLQQEHRVPSAAGPFGDPAPALIADVGGVLCHDVITLSITLFLYKNSSKLLRSGARA